MEQVSEAAKPPFVLEGIDHILLLVSGVQPAVRFYTEVLGCTVEDALPHTACCNCAPARH